jgi:hypothetical protein
MIGIMLTIIAIGYFINRCISDDMARENCKL